MQQYSEVEEAFAVPGQLLTRGEHFHDEAIRLWRLEGERASLATIQALLILAYECETLVYRMPANLQRLICLAQINFSRQGQTELDLPASHSYLE